jgi:hypothetical protein
MAKFIMLKWVPDDYAVRLEAFSIAVNPAIERFYFFFASFAPLRLNIFNLFLLTLNLERLSRTFA